MNTRKFVLALLATFALAASQVVAGPVISVNFVGGQANPGPGGAGADSVTGTAGVVPVGNWNNYPNRSGAALVAINDSGAAAATVTYNATNNWAATGAAPGGGGNASLMSGYLDNYSNVGNNTITVAGLGALFTTSKGYDVYVYHASDSAGVQGYSVLDNLANADTAYGRQVNGAGTNFPLAGPNGFIVSESLVNSALTPSSNAVLLRGLTGSSFTITGLTGAFGDGRARPNGFQIVALGSITDLPEPASVAVWTMMGLGLAGYGCLRLRRKK